VSQRAAYVSDLEHGRRRPSETTSRALARALVVDHEFFSQPLTVRLERADVHFRRLRKSLKRDQQRVVAYGCLLQELIRWIEGIARFPEVDVPSLPVESFEDVESAAETCRRHWGLELDRPIASISRVMERAGIVVSTLHVASPMDGEDASEQDLEGIDGCSWWLDRPIAIRSTRTGSTSRARLDLVHELGHLVMHRGMETGDKLTEGQAFHFGGAFVFPRGAVEREFPRRAALDWAALFRLKRRWGLSVAALIRRAFDLRMISPAQYVSANRLIRSRRWHRGEPDEPADEPQELLPGVFSLVAHGKGLQPQDIAGQLHWGASLLEEVTGFLSVSGSTRGVRRGKLRALPINHRSANDSGDSED